MRRSRLLIPTLIGALAGCHGEPTTAPWRHTAAQRALQSGVPSDATIGQSHQRATRANRTDAGSIDAASGVAVGGGHLWVADSANARVLGWSNVANLTGSSNNGTDADKVLLQPDMFVVDHRNQPTVPIEHNVAPIGVAVDQTARVYVYTSGNVLVFDNPYTDDDVADYQLSGEPTPIVSVRALNNNKLAVVGQSSIVFYEQGQADPYGQASISSPCGASMVDITEAGSSFFVACATGLTCTNAIGICSGIFVYAIDNTTKLAKLPPTGFLAYNDFSSISSIQVMNDFLLIVDSGTHRIAHFSGATSHAAGVITAGGSARCPVISATCFAGTSVFYGQPDATSGSADGSSIPQVVSANGFNSPTHLAIDATDQRMWVTDALNHRVLGFNNVAVSAPTESAQVVLGQPDMSHNLANRLEAASFVNITGVATGPGSGQAVRGAIADADGNRVLVYDDITQLQPNGVPDHVIGQATGENYAVNAFSTAPNVEALDLRGPRYVAIDPSGTVWVNDAANNRILAYEALGSSSAATRAYGAIDTSTVGTVFTAMRGFAVTSTHVFVASTNRVLIWEVASPGEAPWRVLGQDQPTAAAPLVIGNTCNRSGVGATPRADTLCDVSDLAVDTNGTLWVADRGNDRVLWFDLPADNALTDAVTADGVVGQTDFVRRVNRAGLGVGPYGFAFISGIAVDNNGTLWVADQTDNRVLAFFEPKDPDVIENMPRAGLVLGQPNMLTAGANSDPNGVNGRTMSAPFDVAVDPGGRVVLVSDAGNNRVLRYIDNAPPVILGTGSFDIVRGETASVQLTLDDPDGDPVDVQLAAPTPPGASLNVLTVSYEAPTDAPLGTVARINIVATDQGPRPQSFTASLVYTVIERPTTPSGGPGPEPRAPRVPGKSCAASPTNAWTAMLLVLPIWWRRRKRT
ncbi:MAG: NHL repeat-containing protein [Myxococcota bacterium]